jgi:hypothetical protein
MVSRPKMPEGKRIPISFKISEPVAAEIDKARGSLTRAAWIQGAIDKALAADAGYGAGLAPGPVAKMFMPRAAVAEPSPRPARQPVMGYSKSRQLGGKK